jgi:hypothetical protein
MSAWGHFRQSIGVPPTDGLPSIAEGQCPARTIGSSTPTSGPTRAVSGMEGLCQKQPWFDIHDKVNEIAANGFCGFGGGPGFSVTHGQIER